VITRAFIGKRVFGSTGERVNGALPAEAEFGVTELRAGLWSAVAGVDRVKGREPDVPLEFVTVTAAVPGNAPSVAGTITVSCVALTNVVALTNFVALIRLSSATPFQFTVASLVKFVPFTVSVKSCELQYGAEAAEVVDADSEAIAGGVPGAAPIVKRTMFETSVVVVLLTFDDPD
jgi:hypothetical protein